MKLKQIDDDSFAFNAEHDVLTIKMDDWENVEDVLSEEELEKIKDSGFIDETRPSHIQFYV
jgi:hypothetical protein